MKCPTCQSPQPHLHPAIQHEGEVHTCTDPFHDRVTPQNTPAYRARVVEERSRRQQATAP